MREARWKLLLGKSHLALGGEGDLVFGDALRSREWDDLGDRRALVLDDDLFPASNTREVRAQVGLQVGDADSAAPHAGSMPFTASAW